MSDHQHNYEHGGTTHGTRLLIAFSITSVILIAEVVGAILTSSLALIVDAGHMLTDAGGLGLALFAARLVNRPTTNRRTYGFARAEVLSATAQASVLLAVGLFVLVEGIQRLIHPPVIASGTLAVFGIIGLVGNMASIAVLASGRDANFNLRAAFLEVVNDALGSLAVIVAAIVITLTGWTRADAVAAILIGGLILPRALKLLLETVNVLLESVPRGLDLDAVRTHLLELPHVRAVHDLHVTQVSSSLPILTAHVVVEDECFNDGHIPDMLDALQGCAAEHFTVPLEHSTFQLEPAAHAAHEAEVHS